MDFYTFFALLGIVGLFFAGCGCYQIKRSWAPVRWPTTQGRVKRCTFMHTPPSDHDGGDKYWVSVEYIYSANGIRHYGTQIAIGYEHSHWRSVERAIYERLNSSCRVIVRYDPQKTDNAVLSYGGSNLGWVFFFFGGIFCSGDMIAISLWITGRLQKLNTTVVLTSSDTVAWIGVFLFFSCFVGLFRAEWLSNKRALSRLRVPEDGPVYPSS